MIDSAREPPLLMNNCKINPEWERWLKLNHPTISDELTNANIYVKILSIRATLDIVLKETWDQYSSETLDLLKYHPEIWPLLQSMDPPKPTLLQRLVRFIKRLNK